MLKYIVGLLALFTTNANYESKQIANVYGNVLTTSNSPNGCISFSVGPGTGCAWMCNYCENQLGSTNYYFTNGVCSYQSGGCVGNPQAGVTYTCCSN